MSDVLVSEVVPVAEAALAVPEAALADELESELSVLSNEEVSELPTPSMLDIGSLLCPFYLIYSMHFLYRERLGNRE